MVSSLVPDAIAHPAAVLAALFDPGEPLDAFPHKASAHFSHIFRAPDAFDEIPPLGVMTPPELYKEKSLVRFRAMIQDTSSSPEMYLARRSAARCGGWGLAEDDADATNQDHIDYADLRERAVLWAVTIPGESVWCTVHRNGEPLQTNSIHHPPRPHKFPVPNASHVGVQVKIYNDPTAVQSLKSTDLYDFVGILAFEPLHSDIELASPTLVPTLHVLFFKPVPSTILPRVYPCTPSISALREELITWIADECLAGDRLVAEWLLLCSIARVRSRTPPILPLTLTVSFFPSPPSDLLPLKNHVPALSHVLSQIFPLLTTIHLSLETLHSTNFTPESKNEDLHSGFLQVPSGSVCLTTESGLTEGGVLERGVMNIRAIQEIINAQTLQYAFPYSQFSFNTDIAFVVLSRGRKSTLFQTHVNVPLRPVNSKENSYFYKSADDIVLPPQEKLDMYRSMVGGAKIGAVSVNEQMGEFIQNDFVNERKAASTPSETTTSDDLIQRMMVARLLALSLHETEITVPLWERAKTLEVERRARLF